MWTFDTEHAMYCHPLAQDLEVVTNLYESQWQEICSILFLGISNEYADKVARRVPDITSSNEAECPRVPDVKFKGVPANRRVSNVNNRAQLDLTCWACLKWLWCCSCAK